MSIRQPVSRAARRAFCPSRPMARDSWKSGTTTRAALAGARPPATDRTWAGARPCPPTPPGRRQRIADEPRRVGVPVDDVDLLPVQLGHDRAHPRAERADAGAPGPDGL